MKDASKGYKVKDFVFLGIVTAIYVVAYSAIGGLTAALNALGHAFSPAIFSLIGGTIILFLVYKVPKLGILTLQTLLVHGLIAVLGMAYLPWFITSIIGALIADGIAATSQYKNTIKNGLGFAFMQAGSSAGGIIPAVFFAESYKRTWIERGMTAAQMDETIAVSVGWIGASVLIASFVCGFLGILIGRKILAKHFKS